ncbi:hypothetical protein [Salinivibrio sp. ES.052]|uniref:hypothetical protein n=1 Tax=Salinivibrio sp. ES.052 TaxID=1882823 RepID=UPI000928631E|nr:hypothetical protein [Salinivibrio sp. ES.052]SIO42680.1 hypothetical protein SAMN05444724_3360 [Salinivibrio sp. ES.052]
MFEDFIGEKIKYVQIDEDGGEVTTMGSTLINSEGYLIKLKAPRGDITIINTTASNFVSLELMD